MQLLCLKPSSGFFCLVFGIKFKLLHLVCNAMVSSMVWLLLTSVYNQLQIFPSVSTSQVYWPEPYSGSRINLPLTPCLCNAPFFLPRTFFSLPFSANFHLLFRSHFSLPLGHLSDHSVLCVYCVHCNSCVGSYCFLICCLDGCFLVCLSH